MRREITVRRLEREFHYVRETFFPRWDRKRKWSVERAPDLNGAQGKSDTEAKVIRIIDWLHGDQLLLTLIHEIAHDAASPGHGKKWQERMAKAAEKAEAVGGRNLANLLRKEIGDYLVDSDRPTAAEIYGKIKEAVTYCPGCDFLKAVDTVRRHSGFTRQEFIARYPRAKRVFDKEKKRAKTQKAGPRTYGDLSSL